MKEKCCKCGKEEEVPKYIEELIKEYSGSYVCGNCHAEHAQKSMEDTFDRTFGGHK